MDYVYKVRNFWLTIYCSSHRLNRQRVSFWTSIDFIYHYTFFEITKFSKILSKLTFLFENFVKFRKYFRKKCQFRKYFRKFCNFEKNVNGRWSHYKSETHHFRLVTGIWPLSKLAQSCIFPKDNELKIDNYKLGIAFKSAEGFFEAGPQLIIQNMLIFQKQSPST